jgi:hypothetical protein
MKKRLEALISSFILPPSSLFVVQMTDSGREIEYASK